jgi:purine nucleosidase
VSVAALPIPLVIDTDTGTDVDDALALLLALASPEVDLLGVTVVDGDVDLRARMVARLLGMAGRADIPVFKGLAQPLGAGRMPTMRGHEGRGLLDVPYSGPLATIRDTPAVDWLIAESARRPYHLAAIGPYTNVAAAIQRDPAFATRLLGLTVMGGMVHEAGYSPQWQRFFAATGVDGAWLDHNTQSDPTAALVAATSAVPMTWVTAELTFHLPLTTAGLAHIAAVGSPLSDAIVRMAEIWNDEWFRFLGIPYDGPSPFPEDAVACLHDPLALAALFPGDWLTLSSERLRYVVDNGLFRTEPNLKNGDAARISVAADPAGFERFYLDRVEAFLRRVAC